MGAAVVAVVDEMLVSDGFAVAPKVKEGAVDAEVAEEVVGVPPKEKPPEVEAGCETAVEDVGVTPNENTGAAGCENTEEEAVVAPKVIPPEESDGAGVENPENPANAEGFGPPSVVAPPSCGQKKNGLESRRVRFIDLCCTYSMAYRNREALSLPYLSSARRFDTGIESRIIKINTMYEVAKISNPFRHPFVPS